MFWDQVRSQFYISSLEREYLGNKHRIWNLDSFHFDRQHFINRWLFLDLGKKRCQMVRVKSNVQAENTTIIEKYRKSYIRKCFSIISFIYFKLFAEWTFFKKMSCNFRLLRGHHKQNMSKNTVIYTWQDAFWIKF